MDARFVTHNSHLQNKSSFAEKDPDLILLATQHYIHQFHELEQFPTNTPGIFSLAGMHRVGKTTLLKQWMEKLLHANVSPANIMFFSGDNIEDYHDLQRVLVEHLSSQEQTSIRYLIIDDVTAVRNWEKAISFLLQEGWMKNIALMLSGSDVTLAQQIQKYFAPEMVANFRLSPLSFRSVILLKHGEKQPDIKLLYEEFQQYLIHGGLLFAINDIAQHGQIQDDTLISYVEWLCKNTIKRGRQERFLREILTAVLKHLNERVTWNSLVQELSIDHPKTIGDYLEFLEAMDIIFIQFALAEKTLQASPKKARKIIFSDPFIFHAIYAWLSSSKKNLGEQIDSTLANAELCSKLVEACVISQCSRHFPTYYIKAEGDVDLAYVNQQHFWPIEITWESQIRSKDLKQILKYQNGKILTKTARSGIIQHIKTEPLPLASWQWEESLSDLKK